MPWSAKALELLRQQYAAVGAASGAALTDSLVALEMAASHGADVASPRERYKNRARATLQFVDAYRRYC
jgi:protein phosphatase